MTKKRAYTSPTGRTMLSAQQVKEIRDKRYNKQPYPDPLYSVHPPGERKPVHHVNKGATGYFAYNPNGSPGSAASDGESLNHLLFKEALAGLTRTRLVLFQSRTGKAVKWADVPITVLPTPQPEKPIPREEGQRPLFADIYLEFESPHWLAEKWGGKVYVELRHTHPIEADKQQALRKLDLPVIEVDISEAPYAYPVDEDDTTDEKEAAHVQRLRHMLEHENGFLKAVVLSDPSSLPYLKRLVKYHKEENKALRAKLEASEVKVQEATDNKALLEKKLEGLQGDQKALTVQRSQLDQQLQQVIADHKSKVNQYSQLKQAYDEVETNAKKDRRSLHFNYGLLVIGLSLLLAETLYFLYRDDPAPQPPAVAEVAGPNSASSAPEVREAPVKTHSSRRSHGH